MASAHEMASSDASMASSDGLISLHDLFSWSLLVLIGTVFVMIWEMLSASAAASEFREWVQVGIDGYIPLHKCQVKSH